MPLYRARRSYGRRRRYNRRRPSTSASVPRSTLAPRHQYLKLRTSFSLQSNPAALGNYGVILSLDNPSDSIKALNVAVNLPTAAMVVTPGSSLNRVALGYAEYGQIFSRYLVHGCKVSATVALEPTASSVNNSSAAFIMVPRIDTVPIATEYEMTARLPLTTQHIATFSRPAYIKKYFSCSKIQGRSVKLFNEYYYPWTLPEGTSGQSSLAIYTEALEAGTRMVFRFQMTYYMSAIEVKSQFSSATAFAAAEKASLPGAGPTYISDPTHADFVSESNSGVPLSTENMRKLGVTRRRD